MKSADGFRGGEKGDYPFIGLFLRVSDRRWYPAARPPKISPAFTLECTNLNIKARGDMEKSVSYVSRREFLTGSAALAAVGRRYQCRRTGSRLHPRTRAEFDYLSAAASMGTLEADGRFALDHKPAAPAPVGHRET